MALCCLIKTVAKCTDCGKRYCKECAEKLGPHSRVLSLGRIVGGYRVCTCGATGPKRWEDYLLGRLVP